MGSAESWGVQHLARWCRDKSWRLALLELEGHGLSSGARGICGDFDRLQRHVSEFVEQTVVSKVPFAIGGNSLGGMLAAYTADSISSKYFIGGVFINPACGVDASLVPGQFVVSALSLLSTIVPAAQLPMLPEQENNF